MALFDRFTMHDEIVDLHRAARPAIAPSRATIGKRDVGICRGGGAEAFGLSTVPPDEFAGSAVIVVGPDEEMEAFARKLERCGKAIRDRVGCFGLSKFVGAHTQFDNHWFSGNPCFGEPGNRRTRPVEGGRINNNAFHFCKRSGNDVAGMNDEAASKCRRRCHLVSVEVGWDKFLGGPSEELVSEADDGQPSANREQRRGGVQDVFAVPPHGGDGQPQRSNDPQDRHPPTGDEESTEQIQKQSWEPKPGANEAVDNEKPTGCWFGHSFSSGAIVGSSSGINGFGRLSW